MSVSTINIAFNRLQDFFSHFLLLHPRRQDPIRHYKDERENLYKKEVSHRVSLLLPEFVGEREECRRIGR